MIDPAAKRRSPGRDNQTTLADVKTLSAQELVSDHGGAGRIVFRRVFEGLDLGVKAIQFVDFTEVLPGSSIGCHCHSDTLEIYFVVSGCPLVMVDSSWYRLRPGGISVVQPGGSHSLVNDTIDNVQILVIEVSAT